MNKSMSKKIINNKGVILNKFVDFNVDKFIKRYLEEVEEYDYHVFLPSIPPEEYKIFHNPSEEEYQKYYNEYYNTIAHHNAKRGATTKNVIIPKVLYLQDLIIRKSLTQNENGVFRLSSKVLKSILGDEYITLLRLFVSERFLNNGDGNNGHNIGEYYYYYKQGKGSKMFSVPNYLQTTTEFVCNTKVIKLLEKEKQALEKYRNEIIVPAIDNRYGKNFREQYEKSLRKIQIKDRVGLDNYIPIAIKEQKQEKIEESKKKKKKKNGTPMIEHYYNYLVNGLEDKDKKITRIDEAGRIYHILTNADRNVKQFLNIKISVDCKNSHPLLFNYFIFREHNISNADAYDISNSMHYIQGVNIKKELSNVVDSEILKKFTNDELEYIYLTSRGEMWDVITEEHPELDRNEVKVEMFQQVFYSNEVYVRGWQDKAKEFKNKFPNVLKTIKLWKKEENDEVAKQYFIQNQIKAEYDRKNALSIVMMNLESRIFTGILERMYSKRWNAIHIHDCIIVPETINKNQPTRDEVIEIMKDVYKQYGLAPTFSE